MLKAKQKREQDEVHDNLADKNAADNQMVIIQFQNY